MVLFLDHISFVSYLIVLEFEADEFLDQSNPLVVPKLKLMKQVSVL